MALFDKPIAVEKFRRFHRHLKSNDYKIGKFQRGIDVNLNNACNLRCEHCFTESPKGVRIKEYLDSETIKKVSDQAHELGIFEYDLQGGELTLRPKLLLDTLHAIGTSRFYMYLTTNGYKLDGAFAAKLAEAGVDRVSVSIDSMNPSIHDKFRGKRGSWRRAMDALHHVKAAGMDPYFNITVGTFNINSDDLIAMLDYSLANNFTTLINIATPGGMWTRNIDVLCREEDTARLIDFRKRYKNILRNLWNPFDRDYEGVIGCNTVNRLYVTPIGDVLPCPYVHIKLGNIFEESLKEISERGFGVPEFSSHSQLCLAGEDRNFINSFMGKGYTIFNPMSLEEMASRRQQDSVRRGVISIVQV